MEISHTLNVLPYFTNVSIARLWKFSSLHRLECHYRLEFYSSGNIEINHFHHCLIYHCHSIPIITPTITSLTHLISSHAPFTPQMTTSISLQKRSQTLLISSLMLYSIRNIPSDIHFPHIEKKKKKKIPRSSFLHIDLSLNRTHKSIHQNCILHPITPIPPPYNLTSHIKIPTPSTSSSPTKTTKTTLLRD